MLAYVLGDRKDTSLLALKALLEPFGITQFYTDDWGAYERHLPADQRVIGKSGTQKIERKHLTLRTRIKRWARKTICFSKLDKMHDIVIGLFVNRYEFGILVWYPNLEHYLNLDIVSSITEFYESIVIIDVIQSQRIGKKKLWF